MPPIPFALMSGYAGGRDIAELRRAPGFVGFVPKPRFMDALTDLLAEFGRPREPTGGR